MNDEFSVMGDEYHKTLFGNDWTDVFDAIRKYPLIFGGVNRVLRKYLSYLFIREVTSVDLISGKKKLDRGRKIEIGLELMDRMIERGGLDDWEEVENNERRFIYRMQNTSVIKLKLKGSGSQHPFWYVDTNHFKEYALKERKVILERIKSQAVEYSSQSYYRCDSCGKIYDSEEFFQSGYRCEECGTEHIKFSDKHPNTQLLRDVLKRMNAEISS